MCCTGPAFSAAEPKFSISEHLAVLDGLVFKYFQLQVPHALPMVFVLASDTFFWNIIQSIVSLCYIPQCISLYIGDYCCSVMIAKMVNYCNCEVCLQN